MEKKRLPWFRRGAIFLSGLKAIVLGVIYSFVTSVVSFPAYRMMHTSTHIWGTLWVVLGVVVLTLLAMHERRPLFLSLIILACFEIFWGVLVAAATVGHGESSLIGTVLFAGLGIHTWLIAMAVGED